MYFLHKTLNTEPNLYNSKSKLNYFDRMQIKRRTITLFHKPTLTVGRYQINFVSI